MPIKLGLLLVSFFFTLRAISGALLHWATWAHCTVTPTLLATLIYLGVFGFVGLPLLMGTVMWRSEWNHKM